jgi:isocitrate dehydrogenase (NAD+)
MKRSDVYRVAVVRGDGIGPEITEATQQVLEATGLNFEWIEAPMGQDGLGRLGAELPWESIEMVRKAGVALKAPLLAERMSGGVIVDDGTGVRRHASVNNGLRRELSSYANLRPIRGWKGISAGHEALDIVIVREVSEGIYSGIERQVDEDTAEAVNRVTRSASRRLARYAFEYAARHGRAKVSAIHKANVLHLADGTFLGAAQDVASEFPAIEFDDKMVDAACYLMVKTPGIFDVMAMPNQYGDIMSDLVAGLAGSLGLAPGANIGPDTAVFEASHGAAPDIAGKGIANPMGLMLSGAMLLDHLGESGAAGRVRHGIQEVLSGGRFLTPDLGGSSGSAEMTRAICGAMQDA